ncbi:MAG: outer membrane beta-barrel protein, partial [Bacteroidota bacterium]
MTQKNLYANGFERNFTKFILPDTLYYNNQNRDVVNNKDKYGINLSYEWAVDSFNTFRIKTYAATQSTSDLSSTVADNRNENEALVNQNERLNRYNATTQNINTSLLWMRKFRTTGRSLSPKLEYGHDNRNSDELLQSTLRFFDTAQQVINSLTLDQMQLDRSRNNRINTTINYTEPLSKKVFVLTDYSLNVIQSNRSRTVNAKSNNEYTLFLDSLSNALDYSSYVHTGGLSLRYVYKKWNATAGGKVGYTELEQFNQIADTGFSQNFINIFPSASIQFKRKNTSNINLRYNGSTRQPTIEQLQPLRDLTNPLLIEVGNPNLVQSFTNRISLNYNSYQPIKGRGMYMSLTGRFIQDDFTQSEEVDAFGRRTVQTINMDGNADMWGFITFWYEIKKLNLDINLNLNPSLNRRVNRVNQRE